MNRFFQYCIYLFLTTMLFAFPCCKKDNGVVPNVYTDIYLYTTDPAFAPLNAIGGHIYAAGGSKGVLIYRKSQTEFMAYDRQCTYKVEDGNIVNVDASGLLAVDSKCNSKFLITDGSPNQGPAINPLKRYQTTFDGTVLHIYN